MIPTYILVIENDDDREFMAALYMNYNRLMYQKICQIVRNKWVAEDLLQEVLVKLIDKVKELRTKDRDHLVNYIIAASMNIAKNYLRDSNRNYELAFDNQVEYPNSVRSESEVEIQLIRESDLDTLARIWAELDERNRYLLRGRYILELSVEEMAKELKIKPASIRMALTRARKIAYQMLTEELQVPS